MAHMELIGRISYSLGARGTLACLVSGHENVLLARFALQ